MQLREAGGPSLANTSPAVYRVSFELMAVSALLSLKVTVPADVLLSVGEIMELTLWNVVPPESVRYVTSATFVFPVRRSVGMVLWVCCAASVIDTATVGVDWWRFPLLSAHS